MVPLNKFLLVVAVLASMEVGHAADYTWDGGGNNGQWATAGNWNPDGTPATGDTATFANAYASGGTTITLPNGSQLARLLISNTSTSGVTLTAGSLNFTGSGTSGAIEQIAGISSTNFTINSNIEFSGNSGGTFRQFYLRGTGGTVGIGGNVTISNLSSNSTYLVDIENSSGSSSFTQSSLSVISGTGTINYHQFLRTNASAQTITLNGANTFTLNAANYIRYEGAGGTLALGSATALGNSANQLNIGAAGTLNTVNSRSVLLTGEFTVANNVRLFSGAGTTTIGGSNSSGRSIWSGTVQVDRATIVGETGNTTRLTAAVGGTVEFSGVVSTGTSGAAGAAGAIEKVGGGTVILSRSSGNSYTGGTIVSAGTLLVNNTTGSASGLGTGSVAVNAGILGGTGIIAPGTGNSIAVQNGAFLAPGDSTTGNGIGTLVVNGGNTSSPLLTLSSGAKLSFQLGSALSSDKLNFWNFSTGDFVLDSNVIDVTLLAGATTGTYNLFNFFSGLNTGLTASGISSGLSLNFLNGGEGSLSYGTTGQINLVLTAVPEPAAWVLVAGGLSAMLIFRRRRKL